ncbi:MAG: pseudouridine synthase [Prochlorococcus sp.]
MTQQRLQKLIAAAGLCSRRQAEELLRQERVCVNGKLSHLGDQADPELDSIAVDGEPLPQRDPARVLLLNKPRGVISSCNDPQGRQTVLELLPVSLRHGLHPVGRLDGESRGALLLTNHGELTLQLTHPRYAHSKTYRVWVRGIPSPRTLRHWRDGVILDGERTLPAEVELIHSSQERSLLQVVIRQGRNRQIRRLADLLGHPVLDLKRTAIAGLRLGSLTEGHWRQLNREEWEPMLMMTTDA